VNRLVPQSELSAAALDWATIFARNAPLAMRATKRATLDNLTLEIPEALKHEGQVAAPVMRSEDTAEGLRAFAEKRMPVFRGR
jgi:enoyl-CoA hydratase/carnithine racemase